MLSSSLNPLRLLAMAVGLLLAVDIHECAHAWAANELGDPTARYQGRLSLNPIVHLDPMGTLMMAFSLLSGFGIGWGKPVPVNPWNLRHGRLGHALVALSGPVSNLVLAAALAVPLRAGWIGAGLVGGLWLIALSVNVSLALFNLLPIAPLDGGTVLVGLFSAIGQPWARDVALALERFQSQAPMAFLVLILADQMLHLRIFSLILGAPFSFIMRLLLRG